MLRINTKQLYEELDKKFPNLDCKLQEATELVRKALSIQAELDENYCIIGYHWSWNPDTLKLNTNNIFYLEADNEEDK